MKLFKDRALWRKYLTPPPRVVAASRVRASARLQLARPPGRRLAHQKDRGGLYATTAPKLSAWMEENLSQGLSVFALPAAHQRKLRTSNGLERVNQEIKRRTRVARIFPNEASVLRIVTALLVELSEQWETGKIYLSMEPVTQPST